MLLTDRKIGVLMGGTSAEREVSLKSGNAMLNALKSRNYNAVGIDAGPDICGILKNERIDVAVLALHGGCGENGAMQGMLEVLNIPYSGSGVLASALAMDKEASKKIFLYHNIPVAPFKTVTSNEWQAISMDKTLPLTDFGLPLVIKPATEGSSIGVNIVRDEASLKPAIDEAFRFCERVVIEKYIEGMEVHVGMLNDRALGSVEVRPKSGFYSYQDKYEQGRTEYILPPGVPADLLRKAEDTALSAHRALGCRGATRVDLIIDKQGNPCVLEVNTLPGMTETSLLPKIARMSGLDFPALIEEILREVITRGTGR